MSNSFPIYRAEKNSDFEMASVEWDENLNLTKVSLYCEITEEFIDMPYSKHTHKLWERCHERFLEKYDPAPDEMSLAKAAAENALCEED